MTLLTMGTCTASMCSFLFLWQLLWPQLLLHLPPPWFFGHQIFDTSVLKVDTYNKRGLSFFDWSGNESLHGLNAAILL